MIYLKHTTDAQAVLVPATGAEPVEGLALVLRSTVDLISSEWAYATATTSPGLYLSFTVNLPEGFPEGSCEYELTAGGKVLSSGVAQVGGYPAFETVQYEKEIIYEQYGE